MGQRFTVIRGSVPALGAFPAGCRFSNRCNFASAACGEPPPTTVLDGGHRYRCWTPQRETADVAAG